MTFVSDRVYYRAKLYAFLHIYLTVYIMGKGQIGFPKSTCPKTEYVGTTIIYSLFTNHYKMSSRKISRHKPIPHPLSLTLTTLKYFCINHEDQRVSLIQNHHTCLSWVFRRHLNKWHGFTAIIFFQCGDRFYTTSNVDV